MPCFIRALEQSKEDRLFSYVLMSRFMISIQGPSRRSNALTSKTENERKFIVNWNFSIKLFYKLISLDRLRKLMLNVFGGSREQVLYVSIVYTESIVSRKISPPKYWPLIMVQIVVSSFFSLKKVVWSEKWQLYSFYLVPKFNCNFSLFNKVHSVCFPSLTDNTLIVRVFYGHQSISNIGDFAFLWKKN